LFVFKHFPLPFHKQAPAAAEAAWCAGRQGKFWEMHERQFGVFNRLQDFDSQAAAREIGVDMALYNACRAGGEAEQQVRADRAEGEKVKVSGTPVFFFGTIGADRRVQVSDTLVGAKSVEEFRLILDKLIRRL